MPSFHHAAALAVADQIAAALRPVCETVVIAGSLRRQQAKVGDVDLVYVPKVVTEPDPADMFATRRTNQAEEVIARLLDTGVLAKRFNARGLTTFGPSNKLMTHKASGIPVCLFSTVAACLQNYLVCRTGPAKLNHLIAALALERGWRWNVHGVGFTQLGTGLVHAVTREEEVFEFVGLPYLEPEDRTA